MTTTWILISVSAALFFLLCISLYYNYRFGRIVLEMQDAIEESLDVMDDHYARISEILEIPLFFDSPQVRQVLDDIQAVRESILEIAGNFATIDDENSVVDNRQAE